MKKNLITVIAALALVLVSCKKDRTCECTSQITSQTSTQPGYTYTAPPASKTSTKYTKVKKDNVNMQLCVSSEETDTYTQTSYSGTTTVNYDVTRVTKNDCTIK